MKKGIIGGSSAEKQRYPFEGNRSNGKPSWKIVPISLAILIPMILPAFHMSFLDALWTAVKKSVDKDNCSCSCWDTIFKGDYENGRLVNYKHVYFNSTFHTFKMWSLTVIFVLFLYSCFRRFFSLLFSKQIRWSMGILFLCNLHNQYYVWWCTWNYINDGFHSIHSPQLIFIVTEAASFGLVLFFMDDYIETKPFGMLVLAIVSFFHVVSRSWEEQFIDRVFFGSGPLNHMNELISELIFMACDLLICMLALCELRSFAINKKRVSLFQLLCRRPVITFSVILFMSLINISLVMS